MSGILTNLKTLHHASRIIAIPLTKPRILGGPRLPKLTYYNFQFDAPPQNKDDEQQSRLGRVGRRIATWATTKATDTWDGWGRSEGGWKLKTYQTGERIFKNIEFEELMLHGIDSSVIKHWKEEKGKEVPQRSKVALLYPSSFSTPSAILSDLATLTQHRTPYHRRRFWMWVGVMPLTAPLKLIPVIPNLPFFFCVWRSWSHYRAYQTSQFLESLLENGTIVPEPSEELDQIYKQSVPRLIKSEYPQSIETLLPTTSDEERATSGSGKDHHSADILLTLDAVQPIVNLFGLKQASEAGLVRAIEQAAGRITKAQ